ncbi:M3 family metallopeptidase [Teredinibacter purpureus]|uniref:M3 family metallopeptidase n=1 Tax=Teredinibacter purpureus TaxID=2731756 RepID=UPI000697D125|nr:M3 family metallopeptidase [Teredinibacter purpureus]
MRPTTHAAMSRSLQSRGIIVLTLIILSLAGCSFNNPEIDDTKTSWTKFDDPQASQYQRECKGDISLSAAMFGNLESDLVTRDNLLTEINRLDILLDRSLSKSGLYRNVHPNADVRTAADECQQKYIKLLTDISLSRAIFNKLLAIDLTSLDKQDKRYVEKMILDYKRSGVNLEDDARARIFELNQEILTLGQSFNKNVRENVRAIHIKSSDRLEGLPQDYIDSHKPNDKGVITITTAYPDYFPIMQYATDDALRLEIYKEFRKRGYPANQSTLKELIEKRHELAQIQGYKTYAEYVTEELMIRTPEAAENFINKVNDLAKPQADKEYQTLLTQLQTLYPDATEVGDWQKTFIESRVKSETFDIDSQEIRQYFSYTNVKQGVFDLTETMFGVKIVPWQTDVWHESVNAYEMYDGKKLVGRFYLDMHPREGKYNHAAAFGIQDGIKGVQPPIAALVCNFPGEKDGNELMEHEQVETFLHEFGHLLHALFGGHQRWLYFSGIKTERDFVEAPSQMLEEWVWDAETLKTFARNANGELIPDELVAKMNAGRYFGRALWTRHQMFYASVSLHFYNQDPDELDLTNTMAELQQIYSPYGYVNDTYFHNSFGHLYGYSAAYYTYMWSLVIASDMFSEFEKQGLRNPSIAKHYRDTVLAPGGTADAAILVEDFLGRPYSFETFSNKLKNNP